MITFIGMHERTSGMVRGMQLAQRNPSWNFVDSRDYPRLTQIKDRIVIFIRQLDKGLAEMMKSQGCTVGYDLLDRPVADMHSALQQNRKEIDWKRYNLNCVDFFLVNNQFYKETLEQYTNKPIHIIPHHTYNFDNEVIQLKEKPDIVGYIGLLDQFTLQREIFEYCAANNLRFICIHPNTRQECVVQTKRIDIGVIYVEKDTWRDYVLKYKPNQKLSSLQSFGIPTVSCDYQSFVEYGGGAYQSANTPDEFIRKLDELVHDFPYRQALHQQSIQVGKKFHIDVIIEKYKELLQLP